MRTIGMRWMLFVLILIVAAPPAKSQKVVQGDGILAELLHDGNQAAVTAGLRPLHDTSFTSSQREIRVWVRGAFSPYTAFYRIVDDGKTVKGEIFMVWSRASHYIPTDTTPRDAGERIRAENHAKVRALCAWERTGNSTVVCALRATKGEDWRAVLVNIESHHVWTLSDAHSNRLGIDGWRMTVETRRGTKYRAFSYFSPRDTSDDPDVRDAAAIVEAIGSRGGKKD